MILATAQFTISIINDGLGIQTTTIDYAVSSSGITPPGNIITDGSGNPIMSNDGKPLTDGDWTTTLPTVPQGMYLWTRTRLVLTNGSFDMIYNVSYAGEDGPQGEDAPTPTHIYREFRLSDSSTTITGSGTGYSWSTTQPKIESGQYLWKREATEYSDGSILYSNAYCEVTMSGVLFDVDKNTQAISGKVWQSDITNYDDSVGKSIRDRVTKTEADISGINTSISTIQSDVSKKADGTSVTTLSKKVNTISDTVDGHTQTIESHESRIDGAEAEITSTKTIASQTADKFTWIVQSGDSASNFTLTDRVAELISPQVVIKDPAGSSTIITGGKIQANAITTAMLATDAIKSTNYTASSNVDSPYSATGTFLDLSNGNFWTQNFGVINATPSGTNIPVGAWFNGTVYANAGRFGDGSSYWNIENFTDNALNEYAGLVATGDHAYIQAGHWQVNDDAVQTKKYITTSEGAGQVSYYYDSDTTHRYYDVGMKIPADFTEKSTDDDKEDIYKKAFFYGRKSTGDYIPPSDADGDWNYLFFVDHQGNIYSSGDIYMKGKKLSELYAAIDGAAGGNYVTTSGSNTINGDLKVTGTLDATAKKVAYELSINGKKFDGSKAVDVGTIGVAYGGTGKKTWTQWGIVYASAANALSQISAGTSGQLLKSNGSAAPTWIDQSSIVAGNATNATNATNDANGNKIDTTYRKLSDTAFPNGLTGNVTGNVSGTAGSVKNNLIIKLNGGTTEGTDLFTYNGSAKKTINITGTSLGLSEASTHGVDTSISSGSTSVNLPTTEAIVSFVEGQNYGVLGVAEGSSNGKISVTTASGTSSVAVHGLGSWAYKSSGAASDVGLGNVTNNKQVKGLSSGTTSGHLVSWGTDGYTVADSGITTTSVNKTVTSLASNNDGKIVLTYLDGTTSDPIEVKIIGQSGSSVSYADALNVNGTAVGSASKPVFINAQGKPQQANTIPTVTLNGSSTTSASFYAPTTVGSNNQYLKSNGNGAPIWATFSKSTVGLGNVDNTADANKAVLTATKFANAQSVTLTGDTTGTASSQAGWSISTKTDRLSTVGDNRGVATTPNDYANKIIFQGLKQNSKFGSPSTDTYSYVVGLRGWSDSSGGDSHELAFNNSGIFHRSGATTSWGSWTKMIDSGNYTSYTVTKTGVGASGSWGISITGNAATATNAINDSDSNPINTTYAKLSGATFTGAVTGTSFSASSYIAANSGNSGAAGGIALYGTTPTTYGIAMRQTSNGGKHGHVQGDWAIYSYMNGADNRGWILKNNTKNTTVASVDNTGNAAFNGEVSIGTSGTNIDGSCSLVMNKTLGCLDFVFN